MDGGTRFAATVDKMALRRVIQHARRVVPVFSAATLGQQVLWLTASNGQLTVEAGTGSETVAQTIPVTGSAAGTAIVPIRLVARLVSLLPNGLVSFSATNELVTVSAGSFETQFRALTPGEADAPLRPVECRYETALAASVLSEGFNHLALALGHSQAWNTAMTGIELTTTPQVVRFAATDLSQLALVDVPGSNMSVPGTDRNLSLVLPGSALNAMAVLLPTQGEVRLSIGDDQADFAVDELALRCRLQHDPYPDYAPIVNTETTRRIEVSRTRLSAAVERVALLANGRGAATVWLEAGADELRVRATDLEIGEAIETRPATITGEACELGLYLWGFLAIVRRLRGNKLIIELGHPNKPLTIYTAEHPSFRYHLLPLATDPPPTRIATT
jgi:DNA polymerase III sliding clamp (beta) subunit (PCNA family)